MSAPDPRHVRDVIALLAGLQFNDPELARRLEGAVATVEALKAALDAERVEVERLTAALQHARDCFAVLDMGACTVRNGDYAPDEVCGKLSDYEDLRAALEGKP
jgi:hypothetical protein